MREIFASGRRRAGPRKELIMTEEILQDRKTLEHYRSKCSWPSLYYEKVQSLIGLIEPAVVIEVGVAHGYHASHILTRNPDTQYIGVDPYRAGYDSSDPFGADIALLFNTTEREGMERLYRAVSASLLDEFGTRASLHRSTSKLVSQAFEPDSIDVVFVDGDHRFVPVLRDLSLWWTKIRPGGLLIGDDWEWPEVKRAAERFSLRKKSLIHLLGDTNSSHQAFFFRK